MFTNRPFLPVGLLLVLLALGVGFGYLEYNSDYSGSGTVRYSVALEPGIKQADLKLSYGAGKLHITESPDRLTKFNLNYTTLKPKVNYELEGDSAYFWLKQGNNVALKGLSNQGKQEWDLALSQDVIWDLDLNLGAAKADLDLSKTKIRSLDLNGGAADLLLRLGDQGLDTEVFINAGAAKVQVLIPETVDLKVDVSGVLTGNNLEAAGLIKSGDYYITPNSSGPGSKVKIYLKGAASKFELVRTKGL